MFMRYRENKGTDKGGLNVRRLVLNSQKAGHREVDEQE